jgi:hypothetical protein
MGGRGGRTVSDLAELAAGLVEAAIHPQWIDPDAAAALGETPTPAAIRVEADHLRAEFERPNGWAWASVLAAADRCPLADDPGTVGSDQEGTR